MTNMNIIKCRGCGVKLPIIPNLIIENGNHIPTWYGLYVKNELIDGVCRNCYETKDIWFK